MRLTFLGTRGNIRMASNVHRYHSSMLVEVGDVRVVIDAGGDWRGRIEGMRPEAILVTHAHPDHVAALRDGAPCPVYAAGPAARALARYPIDVRLLAAGVAQHIGPLAFSAHPVAHSLLAPAVGFRLEGAGASAFYVPDVLELGDARDAVEGVGLYVGDGATWGRAIVRRRDGAAFGHATIETQLDWCAASRVRRAIFTHCGSRIVRMEPGAAEALVEGFGRMRGVSAGIALDGATVELPPHRTATARSSTGRR